MINPLFNDSPDAPVSVQTACNNESNARCALDYTDFIPIVFESCVRRIEDDHVTNTVKDALEIPSADTTSLKHKETITLKDMTRNDALQDTQRKMLTVSNDADARTDDNLGDTSSANKVWSYQVKV